MDKNESVSSVNDHLDRGVSCLCQGGVVAFPTETYYGLAVDPRIPEAVDKLFKIKKRIATKPILHLIEDKHQISLLSPEIPSKYNRLIESYWPGPLTLIFGAHHHINPRLTGKTGTIGMRISPHYVASQLVQRFGFPITATSANISGMHPAKTAQEVQEIFGDNIDYVIDGGKTKASLCSTIVGIENGNLIVIRKGQVKLGTGVLL